MTQSVCKFCQQSFESRDKSRRHCYREECIKQAEKDKERHAVPNHGKQQQLDLLNIEYGEFE